MATNAVVSVKLDRDAGAAYLRLSTNGVARTVAFSEDIYVDLDALGVVVGVELLDLMTPIPMDALASKHPIHSDSIRILTAAIEGQAAAGTASSEGNRPLHVPFGTVTRRKLASTS
ncbi:MAG TPA: DUF2283 domain-containing protein [Pseudonocardiaceae bacterium]|nr:DUF2283 domain-containing protein [Pseudonocardiaceae bacterium]